MPIKRKTLSKKAEIKSVTPRVPVAASKAQSIERAAESRGARGSTPFTETTHPRTPEHESPTRPYVTEQNFANAQTSQRQSFSQQYNRVPIQAQQSTVEQHVEQVRTEQSHRRRGRTPKQTLYMFMGLATGALVVVAGVVFSVIPSNNVAAVMPAISDAQNDQKDITQMTAEEKAQYEASLAEATAQYVTLVSQHILLEADDIPEVIKVTDAQLVIAKDSLFQGVQEGDVVLMFQKSQKAVIYSPARDRIVNVVPLGGAQEADL